MTTEQTPSQSWEAWKGITDDLELLGEIGHNAIERSIVLVPYDGADAIIEPVKIKIADEARANLPA